MKKMMVIALIFGLTFSLSFVPVVKGRETSGQILAKLNNLSPQKRQKVLIKEAKVEREVTIYSSMRQDQLSVFTEAFSRRFPFLKVNAFRVSGTRQAAKVQAEYRAGRHEVDITSALASTAYAIKKEGILNPYPTPQRKFFPTSPGDKAGYFAPLYVVPVVLGYNISQVKKSEVPKSYEELLRPTWKGKMLLDTDDFEWFAVVLQHFGREKGIKYMKKLAQQNLSMRRGRTLQTQLVMAGESPLGIALHGHSVLDFKEKGAPIDWTILDPYFAKANVIGLAKHAPHPHAAALFIDWALSKEGQSKITSFGRVSARRGVQQRFPALAKRDYILVDPNMLGPIIGRITKEHREIFMGGR